MCCLPFQRKTIGGCYNNFLVGEKLTKTHKYYCLQPLKLTKMHKYNCQQLLKGEKYIIITVSIRRKLENT